MRVLILSTGTGQGHNSAGFAVQEYLLAQGVDAIFVDVLNTGNQKAKFIAGLYNGMVTRAPWIFGALYATAERIRDPYKHSIIYWLNTLYARSLYERIMELQPDIIVCPHLFSAQAITNLILKFGLDIPTLGIITDYTCSPFWEETRLTHNIVAHPIVLEESVAHGMPRERLSCPGMPVSARFTRKQDKAAARAVFGIEKETVFAIMGGSMGYGKIPDLAKALLRRAPDAQVVAVCGNNERVLEKTKKIPGVIALGFIDNVDILVDAADLLLTKPGGLSCSEAIAKRVPLVITLPIPGGEEHNARVISSLGMGVAARTVEEAADAACALLADPAAQETMIAAQGSLYCATAAAVIGRQVMRMALRRGTEYELELEETALA
ncbi:MAG: hypothetical protein FWF10_02020 [Clostridiales bacterium]|nr:hypothetical protein [Clostridiales bacterium]